MRTIGLCDLFGRKGVASVVLDGKYPSMWRVQRPDGSLTDMVNLTRAKDAAMACRPNLHRLIAPALAGAIVAVGTCVSSHAPSQSGRIEARTGLRMMPTFP